MKPHFFFLLSLSLAVGCGKKEPVDSFVSPSGTAAFDHQKLDGLLRSHVDAEGNVTYAAWKEKDVPELDAYLDQVRAAQPSRMSRTEAVAFWINVYNALTIRAILEFYPVRSIKDKVSVVGYNVWDDYKIKIEGRDLSLNDVEHRILRKMGEPRIHFALVCAAKSCPLLRAEAYTGARLEDQLADNTRQFFKQPKHYRLDRPNKVVHLSSILDWYGEDFGKNERERLDWISRVVPEEDGAFLRSGSVDVRFIDYDWSLNERSRS